MNTRTRLSIPDFFRSRLATAGLVGLACLTASTVQAGATLNIGDDQAITLGLGMRDSATFSSGSKEFNVDSIRLFLGGSLNKQIKGTFNVEKGSNNSTQVMDAIAQFEFSDGFNVWAGRMLPPSDRANLDGPYYLSAWSYPGVVSQYPARFAGRDDGLTVWGKVAEKKLVYSIGAFRGHNRIVGASNEDSGNLLYAGRLQYNFWDAEPNPAYYTSSTYYGGANVLALGIVSMYQKGGVGTVVSGGDYKAWSIDALMEHKMGAEGALTLEGASYNYDTGGVTDVAPGFSGATATDNVGGINEGKGQMALAAFLVPSQIGWGKLQPYVRYQKFDYEQTDITTKQSDIGVNYVIKGHSARISLNYGKVTTTGAEDVKSVILGSQLQF